MERSTVVDGLLIALGIYILLQVIGGIRSAIELLMQSGDGSDEIGAIFSVIYGAIGILLLRYVHRRRKKRRAEAATKMKEANPIGISIVGILKQSRPLGITLIALYSLIGGVIAVPFGVYIASAPEANILQLTADSARTSGIVMALSGILYAIGGYGLFNRKRWGWLLSVIGAYFGIAWFFVSPIFVRSEGTESLAEISTGIASAAATMAIEVVILYYLHKQRIRAHFGMPPIEIRL